MAKNGNYHTATDILWSRMAILHCYWYLVVKNGNFSFIQTIKHGLRISISHLLLISRESRMAILHCYWHLRDQWIAVSHCYWHIGAKNGSFILLLTLSCSRMGTSHCYWHVMMKNGNFTLLLTSRQTKNGNFTLLLTSDGTKNSNFTFLLTYSNQEWQFHIAIDI